MARGYLGKISAIVTANTSELEQRLRGGARAVNQFAQSLQGQIRSSVNASDRSLQTIFTSLQRLERALQLANREPLSLRVDTNRIRALVSATEQIQKPLGSAARQFEGLSAGVSRSFAPALERVQNQVLLVNRAIEQTGRIGQGSFEIVRRNAEQAAQAVARLSEAQQIANRGPRGSELAFADPRVRDSLNASADLRSRAAAAPAAVLASGQVGRDVAQLARLDNLIVRARAQIESRTAMNIDTTAAEQKLNRLIETQGRLRNSIESQIGGQDFVSRDDLASSASRTREQQAARALADQQRVADNEIALLQRREQAAKEVEARRLADQQRAADNEIAIIQNRERAALEAERRRLANQPVPLGDSLRFNAESRARDRLGPRLDEPFGASQRGLSTLQSQITGIKSQLDALPNSFRSQFIPAIAAAEREFVRLSSGAIPATARQIERAALDVRQLEADVGRVSSAVRLPTFNEVVDSSALRRATGELQALQNILVRIGAQAGGPAADAYSRLRDRIRQAAAAGTLNLPDVRRELIALQQEAARAASQVGRISQRAAFREIQRGGDIASGSFQNVGLAIQQGVFAIEDFFSVTGGLDQRIRAAGNNLSQLGFILGGTTGLIAGVSVAITGQLVAALIRWYNAGIGNEDQLRSLNDALSRQRSLVESLADSFASLAQQIERISLSKQGQDAAQFARQIDDIRKKQQQAAEERIAAVDPAVQRERGFIAARQRQLDNEVDPGARVGLNIAIAAARRREREALAAAVAQPGLDPRQAIVAAAIARADREIAAGERGGDRRARRARAAELARPDLAALDGQNERNQLRAAIARIQAEQAAIQADQATRFFPSARNNAQLAQLDTVLKQLERGLVNAANRLEISVIEASQSAAREIQVAQAQVARAIEGGVQGAVGLQTVLDELGQRLINAGQSLAEARRIALETNQPTDIDAVEAAQKEVDAIRAAIAQRQNEASAIDAATSSLERLSGALDDVAQQAARNVEQAQRRADEARLADLGFSTQRSRDDRTRAERDLQAQRDSRLAVDQAVAAARARAQEDPVTAQIERQIAVIDAQLRATGILNEGERERLAAERAALSRQADDRIRQSINNDPLLQFAKAASDLEAQRQESVARGIDLILTPAQKSAIELARQFNDIRNAVQDQVRNGQLAPRDAQARIEEAQARTLNAALRQTAPAVFALRDQVANAVLQGPSRAALQASDVSTVQGQAELNRLIRGDDASRNQDLVELQRQSNELTKQLVDLAKEAAAPPVLDL